MSIIKRAIDEVRLWFSIKHAQRYRGELAARWTMLRLAGVERFAHVLDAVCTPALNRGELMA